MLYGTIPYQSSNMHLVPPAPSLSAQARQAVAPRDNAFFVKMFTNCYQYLDASRAAHGVVAVPRFSNGDLLLVRLRTDRAQGFSVEFPRGSTQTTNCPQSNALSTLADAPQFDWSPRNVLRLGAVASPASLQPTDVFLLAVPNGALPAFDTPEGVNCPLRIPEQEFRQMIERAEVTDGVTLAAYALYLTRQALQQAGQVIPLLDRRKPSRHLTLVP